MIHLIAADSYVRISSFSPPLRHRVCVCTPYIIFSPPLTWCAYHGTMVQVLRVLRILRTFRIVNRGFNSLIAQQFAQLFLIMLTILFLSTGLFHLFENELYAAAMGYAEEATTFVNSI